MDAFLKKIEDRTLSEEEIVRWLADEVDYLMQANMDRLMSFCYTLDIEEADTALALHPNAPEPANFGLARLIYRRQQRRMYTKETYRPEKLADEDAW